MTNSYECSILGLYSGIFEDIRVQLPTVGGLERDESRLLSTVRTRGLRFLTIDMPAYGKHFDRCLADGRLTPSRITNFGHSKRGKRGPAFLRGLILRVFDKDGVLLLRPCVTAIRALRQLFNGAKKIKMACSEKVRENALARYLDAERSLRFPTLNWVGSRLDHSGDGGLYLGHLHPHTRGRQIDLFEADFLSHELCNTVHDVADRVSSSFGIFDPEEWRPKHGPGVVADGKKGDYKYNFPTWSSRLESVFPSSKFAYANYDAWLYSVLADSAPIDRDVPSHALTVPKSQKTPRIIAKESTASMWCQQIVRDYLETNVSRSLLRDCIHFRDQSYNGNAALLASFTGSHWTVDLSDASDRVSLWLVERIFRRNKSLLDALHSSRSTFCKVETSDGVNYIRMKKFAPQGSATTFPLQTIIFAILAISSVLHVRGLKVSRRNIALAASEVLVFGDDTVVPSDCGSQYVDLLTYCGLTVNYSKTYGTGKFRESCGVEAYDGADVTPAYITVPYQESDPSSIASTVMCANNFFEKGFTYAAAALESTLPKWVRNYLPRIGLGDGRFGLLSYEGFSATPYTRFNRHLQRAEYRALQLKATKTRHQPGGYGHLLQYFVEAPTQETHWESGVDGRTSYSVSKRWEPMLPYQR